MIYSVHQIMKCRLKKEFEDQYLNIANDALIEMLRPADWDLLFTVESMVDNQEFIMISDLLLILIFIFFQFIININFYFFQFIKCSNLKCKKRKCKVKRFLKLRAQIRLMRLLVPICLLLTLNLYNITVIPAIKHLEILHKHHLAIKQIKLLWWILTYRMYFIILTNLPLILWLPLTIAI